MHRTSRSDPARLARIVHHPRTAMAFRAAAAATIAWFIARRLPEPAQQYAYYAPLGAVAATYPTVVGSARESFQGIASILLGASLAVAVDALLGEGPLTVALVVGLGMLLAGLRWLGDQRAYVTTSALFVLIIGTGVDVGYAITYAGLFLLGAVVAVGTNLLLPSLSLPGVDVALRELRGELSLELRRLADLLEAEPSGRPGPPAPTRAAAHARDAASSAVHRAQEAARGNRRARRWPDAVPARVATHRALEHVAFLVDDLHDLLEDDVWPQDPRRAPATLRLPAASALRTLECSVAGLGVREPGPQQQAAVGTAIDDLTRALRAVEEDGAVETAHTLVFASIITSLRRCGSIVTPADRRGR